MRTLILIQSLIIVAGAYYIFTLAHTNDNALPRPVTETNGTNDIVIEIDETPDLPHDQSLNESANTPVAPLPVGNDIGMEFPIPDDEFTF